MRLISVGLLGVLALGGCISEAEKARREEAALIKEAHAAVANKLRDAGSATFSDVEGRAGAVCGVVRGRNGFGGYGEDVRFVYSSIGIAELDPAASPLHPNMRAARQIEQCAFDLDYRKCRGEDGLPSVIERCMAGVDLVEPDVTVTADVAKEACREALERRFNEDIRPGTLTTRSARARPIGDAWNVRLNWEASGDDYSGIRSTGTCVVKVSGETLVIDLND